MVYITHIISISSIFETLGANGSKNTCLILTSIEYSRVFVLVLRANICEYKYSDIREYFPSKYLCKCEYRITYIHKYSYLRIHTHFIPWSAHTNITAIIVVVHFACFFFLKNFHGLNSAFSLHPVQQTIMLPLN